MQYCNIKNFKLEKVYRKFQQNKYHKIYRHIQKYCKEYNFSLDHEKIVEGVELLTIEGINFRIYVKMCSIHIRKIDKNGSKYNRIFYGLFANCINKSIRYIEKELFWDNELRFRNKLKSMH